MADAVYQHRGASFRRRDRQLNDEIVSMLDYMRKLEDRLEDIEEYLGLQDGDQRTFLGWRPEVVQLIEGNRSWQEAFEEQLEGRGTMCEPDTKEAEADAVDDKAEADAVDDKAEADAVDDEAKADAVDDEGHETEQVEHKVDFVADSARVEIETDDMQVDADAGDREAEQVVIEAQQEEDEAKEVEVAVKEPPAVNAAMLEMEANQVVVAEQPLEETTMAEMEAERAEVVAEADAVEVGVEDPPLPQQTPPANAPMARKADHTEVGTAPDAVMVDAAPQIQLVTATPQGAQEGLASESAPPPVGNLLTAACVTLALALAPAPSTSSHRPAPPAPPPASTPPPESLRRSPRLLPRSRTPQPPRPPPQQKRTTRAGSAPAPTSASRPGPSHRPSGLPPPARSPPPERLRRTPRLLSRSSTPQPPQPQTKKRAGTPEVRGDDKRARKE